jgi:PAS domain-containing protein
MEGEYEDKRGPEANPQENEVAPYSHVSHMMYGSKAGPVGLDGISDNVHIAPIPANTNRIARVSPELPGDSPTITEKVFDAIQKSLPVPWAVCPNDGVISKCNSAFAGIFEPDRAIVGESVFTFIDEDDASVAISLVFETWLV